MPTIYVYVDETGDPGKLSPGKAVSPILGMAAVLVLDSSVPSLQSMVLDLRDRFKVPADKDMSCKKHVKTHERKKFAASKLSTLSGVRIVMAYVEKALLDRSAFNGNREYLYNYLAGKLLKSILWAARDLAGSSAEVHVRFGRVKSHDHGQSESYLRQLVGDDPKVPSQMLRSLRWVSASDYLESQAADLFTGFLSSATWPDEFGNVEDAYLRTVWQIIRKNSTGCAIPLGVISLPNSNIARNRGWCSCVTCQEKS